MILKLGIIGLSEGNGHPYSWSAIFNGYEPVAMKGCGYPAIPHYLEQQDWPAAQHQEARVTHIWTQDIQLSYQIAKASRIEHVAENMHDLIGQVDAVLLARDDGHNHLSFAKPFLEAGLPIYIDKPICLELDELEQLYALQQYPGQIFSCSALRYSHEFQLTEADKIALGPLKQIQAIVPKDWARYAVHVIEPLLALAGEQGKLLSSQQCLQGEVCTNHYAWESGFLATVSTMGSAPCPLSLRVIGEDGWKDLFFADTFYAFKEALNDFVNGVLKKEERTDPLFMRRVVEMIELGMQK
ncbi:MAG: putative dehydrogenase [Oleiphilaceae bacterium]|jgi:predicted dehydrogenase